MRKLLPLLLILVALGIVALFVFNRSKAPETGPNKLPEPTLVEVPYDYTVKTVSAEQIVVTGEEGDLTLPNDPAQVTVYMGARDGSPQASNLDALAVGQKVQVDLVPGRSASVYIVQ